MRIKVIGIVQKKDLTVVGCETDIGICHGVWRSRKIKAVPDKTYAAEFTLADISCEDVTKCGDDCTDSAGVYMSDDTVCFRGVCEDYDGEVYYIRFADDWLQMLYIEEDEQHFRPGDMLFFRLRYDRVEIYPYELF